MMYKLYCRGFQQVMRISMRALPWREPELLEGENSLLELPNVIKKRNIQRVLIVTDKGIVAAQLLDDLIKKLREKAIMYYIYDGTIPNPTITNIEQAVKLYHENKCEGIVAMGGGSSIDCAKLTAARIAKPDKTVDQMRGLFKIVKQLPPLFTVPTTAGTGAEATLAAVFSNSETKEKHPVMDISIIPHVAVLDPLLTVKLPPHITAETGMDALTHAVEAYIGKSNTNDTKKWSIEATQLIFKNLLEVYTNGNNVNARMHMQRAAFLAGKAFTRAYVGYVHAIAHQLGGFYNVPHGLANAIVLPYVLEYFGESIYRPLAELADAVGMTKHNETYIRKAEMFIESIKALNNKLNIPTKVEEIQDEHIPIMIKRALNEANPLYPVPKILREEDLSQLFYLIKGYN